MSDAAQPSIGSRWIDTRTNIEYTYDGRKWVASDIPLEDKIMALKGALRWREEVLELRAENDRLRNTIKNCPPVSESEYVRRLEDDYSRLREALIEIRRRAPCETCGAYDIAAAALAKEVGK